MPRDPDAEIARLQRELERAREEAQRWRTRAEVAELRLTSTMGGEPSTGWRLFLAAAALRWRLAPLDSARDRALRKAMLVVTRPLERVTGTTGAAHAVPVAGSRGPQVAAVLFVSQAPEVSKRYRCDHQAEGLRRMGAAVDVARYGSVDLVEAVERYGAFVLHRVPYGPDVEAFLRRARERGRRVLFDTDDLTFDPAAARYVAALGSMPEAERRLYKEGLARYRRTMLECDAVLVSTEPLRTLASELHDAVEVAPNVAGEEMLEWRPREDVPPPDEVSIAYLSGTPTHDRDFEQAADAVLETLRERPGARLLTVGPLRLDERFERFGDRVVQLPFRPWRAYGELLSRIDVNLAPLEPENPFTECKSSVKWLEAGAAGIPTVASPRPDFQRVVEDGATGLLADDPEGWRSALLRLTDDAALRRDLGARAREAVLAEHTTRARAPELFGTVRRLARADDGPLSINWMMLAPVPQNSGGYRNIFRIANLLGEAGHDVRFCVEPVAHLEGMSDREIASFVEETFGPLRGEVVVGNWNAPPADVMIATHWPTAFGVAESRQALFKAYYIQDFEPEFYEASDPRYAEAEKTYSLPLRHICLGRHLADRLTAFSGKPADTIDFALDPAFRLLRDPSERGERVRVLFFARPSLRRRGYGLGIEALAELKRRRPECEVVFFGSTTDELGDVPFEYTNLGVLDAEQVARAMNDAHVLYALSLTNISNVPYEGMACGCAVLDADIPNVSTMVEAGRQCLLAAPEPGAMADALVRLVDDPELRERLGRQGARDQAVRTWQRTASQFEENLRALCFTRLAGRPAAPEERVRSRSAVRGRAAVPRRATP